MPDYTTAAVVKSALGITNNSQDAAIGLAISAASRLINKECRRTFGAGTAATREYDADAADYVTIDDVATDVGLIVKTRDSVTAAWATKDPADYQLEPLNQLRNGERWAFTSIRATGSTVFPRRGKDALIQVTGSFGWPEVPEDIEQACLILACRLLKRPESAMGILGVSDMGAISVTKGLDSDVSLLIDDYRRVDGI